jgi:hypothetical protein
VRAGNREVGLFHELLQVQRCEEHELQLAFNRSHRSRYLEHGLSCQAAEGGLHGQVIASNRSYLEVAAIHQVEIPAGSE